MALKDGISLMDQSMVEDEREFQPPIGLQMFFTTIFHNLEDHDWVFENGPCFLDSIGLYLRFMIERFVPEKEDFSHALVWICLYFFPQEFLLREILEGIKKMMGTFVKIVDSTRQGCYTSYAHICFYMNIYKPLLGFIFL